MKYELFCLDDRATMQVERFDKFTKTQLQPHAAENAVKGGTSNFCIWIGIAREMFSIILLYLLFHNGLIFIITIHCKNCRHVP